MKVNCHNCGIVFDRSYSQIIRQKKNYCSRDCSLEGRKTSEFKKGKEIMARPTKLEKRSKELVEFEKEIDEMPIPTIEEPKPDERTWISLGNRQFYIEDVQSIYIQANHLIVNFDYTHNQIVIHFGYGDDGYARAKVVFDALGEMFNAYKINLPPEAIPDPKIIETYYGDEVKRTIQNAIKMEKDTIKMRYRKKIQKLQEELEMLNKRIKKEIIT